MEETKQKEIRKREGKLKDQEKAVYEGNLKRERVNLKMSQNDGARSCVEMHVLPLHRNMY